MHTEIIRKLNAQLNFEFYSAYFYLDIAGYYTAQGLSGFANWFRVQTQEERDHAMLLYGYLQDNDAAVELQAIRAPQGGYADAGQPLLLALRHEQSVTAAIHALYGAALDEKDFGTMQFLNWFISEQREEEKTVRDIQQRFHLFGGDRESLYLMDSELGARVYTPAAPAAQ